MTWLVKRVRVMLSRYAVLCCAMVCCANGKARTDCQCAENAESLHSFSLSLSYVLSSLPPRRRRRLRRREPKLPHPLTAHLHLLHLRLRRSPPKQRAGTTSLPPRPPQRRNIDLAPTPAGGTHAGRPLAPKRRTSPGPPPRRKPNIIVSVLPIVSPKLTPLFPLPSLVRPPRLIRLPPPLDRRLIVRIEPDSLPCLSPCSSPYLGIPARPHRAAFA